MAYTDLKGPYGNGNWHDHTPTLKASGSMTANRNGSTISGSVSVTSSKVYSNAKYPYSAIIQVLANNSLVNSVEAPASPAWTQTLDFSFNSNDETTLQVKIICRSTWRMPTRFSRKYIAWVNNFTFI